MLAGAVLTWWLHQATHLAGWEGEMELLGMARGTTDRHVGLCSPASVLYRARYAPFPPRLIGKTLIKPLSIPFHLLSGHDLAPPTYNPEELWLLWPSGHRGTWSSHRDPLAQLLPAQPAPGKVHLPLPIPSLCLCLRRHMVQIFFPCLFFLCNLFRIPVLSSGCF